MTIRNEYVTNSFDRHDDCWGGVSTSWLGDTYRYDQSVRQYDSYDYSGAWVDGEELSLSLCNSRSGSWEHTNAWSRHRSYGWGCGYGDWFDESSDREDDEGTNNPEPTSYESESNWPGFAMNIGISASNVTYYGYVYYDYYNPGGPSHNPIAVPFSFGLTQTAPQGPTAAGLIGSITDGGSGGRGLANFTIVDTKGILEAAFPPEPPTPEPATNSSNEKPPSWSARIFDVLDHPVQTVSDMQKSIGTYYGKIVGAFLEFDTAVDLHNQKKELAIKGILNDTMEVSEYQKAQLIPEEGAILIETLIVAEADFSVCVAGMGFRNAAPALSSLGNQGTGRIAAAEAASLRSTMGKAALAKAEQKAVGANLASANCFTYDIQKVIPRRNAE